MNLKTRLKLKEIKQLTVIDEEYNTDEYSPLDGKLIKSCDKFAAFMEASLSIKHGIKSEELRNAKNKIYTDYKDEIINGLDFGKIFESFL